MGGMAMHVVERLSSAGTPDLSHEPAVRLAGPDGVSYRVRVCGSREAERVWIGWIEFVPINSDRPRLRTDVETVQSSRAALAYWASRLSAVYLDGAFARAGGRSGREGYPTLVYEHPAVVADDEDRLYSVRAYGSPTQTGSYIGWLEFVPHGVGPTLRTGRETTQPRHELLEEWARRLERVFLEGALRRAEPGPPPSVRA